MERDRGQGSPDQKPTGQRKGLLKEQANPKGESELSKLLEEKGLFTAYTPEGRDPESYPIEVMRQIKDGLDRRLRYDHKLGIRPEVPTYELVNKYISWRHSIIDMTRAYEIIAYPSCKNQQLRENIKKDLVEDVHQHASWGGMNYVELNDEERELVGKMTTVRSLPFDSEKRIYVYTEVEECRSELETAYFFARKVFR
jgi:hypothetical protein